VLLQVMPNDVPLVIDAVVAAVQRGELGEDRIDASVRRLLERKALLGLNEQRTVDLSRIPQVLARREHVAIAEQAAERSITVVRDRDHLLPIRARRVHTILYEGDPDPFTGRVFQRSLFDRLPGMTTTVLDASADPRGIDTARRLAHEADLVIFAPFIRVGAYKGDLAIAAPVAALVDEIAGTRPVVVTSFGSPYVLSQFPQVGTYVLAWGQWEAPQRAAAKALTGQVPVTGRLPIPIPPYHFLGEGIPVDRADPALPSSPLRSPIGAPRLERALPERAGMDPSIALRIDSVVRVALLEGAAPGAAVAVGRHGFLVHTHGYGRLDERPGYGPVTDSAIYDLASLTKVIATTTAAMILVDEGKLDLDRPIWRYLPELRGGDKGSITARHLLLHNSGLPAWSPLFRQVRGRRAYLDRIAALPLEYPTGTRMVYSDLGAILLGMVVERISAQTLDVFAQERIFGPLGMSDTGFNPIWWVEPNGGPAADGEEDAVDLLRSRIATTQLDTVARLRFVQGNVHDDNAFALGGVAGHAGLYSSARDLAVFAQMMLNGGVYAGRRIVSEQTLREFTRRASSSSTRALGWDTPAERSSAGDYFTAASFGHTGFTGTSLWIDPERDVFVILLTNRINTSPANQRHGPLRRDLADVVQRAIRDMPVTRRAERD
jgi:CubicO group peptidase (beta-lactamase class C family)